MARKDKFSTARLNEPLTEKLKNMKHRENFPGSVNTYVEWLLQQIVDGKYKLANETGGQPVKSETQSPPTGSGREKKRVGH